MKYNIKPRRVRCEACKIEVVTDSPSPNCKLCGSNMITLPRESHLDELARRIDKTA